MMEIDWLPLVFMLALMAHFWPITLALYAAVIWLEFFLARRLEWRGASGTPLRVLACLQMALPFLPLALYPFMPGRESTNEPLGLNEKAAFAGIAGFLAILITFLLSAVWTITGIIRTRQRNTEPAPRHVPSKAAADDGL